MSDACCFLCRSQFGCMNSNCGHHIEARISEDADDKARRLYRDPTSETAIRNIMRTQERRRG